MDYREAIEELKQLLSNPSDISLARLEEIVFGLSVTDTTSPEEAVTHLYTKVNNYDFISSDVRVIDNTDFAKVLMYKDEGESSRLFDSVLEKAILKEYQDFTPSDVDEYIANYLYGQNTDGTTGLWAEASRKFAAETKGAVVVHIGDIDAAQGRTWWNVEMPLILNNEKVTTINGVPKTQMLEMYNQIAASTSDANALENICRLVNDISPDNTQADFLDGATLYYNDQGKMVGVDGSGITSGNFNRMPDECAFSATVGEVSNYADDAKMAEVFGTDTYTNFTEVEKLQAKQSEYWMRQLPDGSSDIWLNVTDDMPHSDNVVKASVEVILKNDSIEHINGVSKQDLQFVLTSGDAGSQSVVDILKVTAQDATDIPNTNSNWFVSSELLEQTTDTYTIYNCYDANGKFVGVELSKTGSDIPLISQNVDDLLRVDTAEFAGEAHIEKRIVLYAA